MTPQQPSKMKTYGTIVIVVLAFVLIYFYMSGGSSSPAAGTLTAGSTYGAVGSSELSLLNQVRSLKIDTALFKDPIFLSLQDYSVSIPPENVGRPNPFAPLPGEAVKPAASQTQAPAAAPAKSTK
jgi:hypothetical protein